MVNKIIVVALVIIFSLFWSHGNAAIPRKLGVRQNAVMALPDTNKVAFRGSSGQFSLISSQPIHINAETNPRILSRQNGVATSQNTKETTSDGLGHQYFIISSSSDDHENAAGPHILGVRHNAVTGLPNKNKITYRGSTIQNSLFSSLPFRTNEETHDPRILSRHNGVTSLQNTKEITSDGLEHQYFTISSSSDDHANATTPHILGVRHNAVTWQLPSLSNKVTSGVSKYQGSHIPRSLALPNVAIPQVSLKNSNEATSPKLGKPQNPIIVTSSPNTNEIANSGQSEFLFNYPIPRSPTQTSVAHHFLRSSSSQMWQPEISTPRKLWASRHNRVTSLPNTYEATSGGSEHQYSPISSSSAHANVATPRILQTRLGAATSLSNTNKAITSPGSGFHHHPISSSSAYTHATTLRTLVRYNVVTGSQNANEATTLKHRERQNPIIVTRLPNINEAANSSELELKFFPFQARQLKQIRVFPRDPNETGHVSSIIN